jgi:hypothetical protein
VRLPRRGRETMKSDSQQAVGGAVNDQTQSLETTKTLRET